MVNLKTWSIQKLRKGEGKVLHFHSKISVSYMGKKDLVLFLALGT
jgi:hypothetical protein